LRPVVAEGPEMTPRLLVVIIIIVLLTGYALAQPLRANGTCPLGWTSSGSYCPAQRRQSALGHSLRQLFANAAIAASRVAS
jgi:hypothetical protein